MSETRGDYSILMSLATREEADVAAAALRAQGVDAFLGNGHAASAMPHLTIGLGGLQVMVPTAQLEEARSLLNARLDEWREEDEDDEPASRRGRWRAWVVVVLFLGPAAGLIVWAFGSRLIERLSQWFGG